LQATIDTKDSEIATLVDAGANAIFVFLFLNSLVVHCYAHHSTVASIAGNNRRKGQRNRDTYGRRRQRSRYCTVRRGGGAERVRGSDWWVVLSVILLRLYLAFSFAVCDNFFLFSDAFLPCCLFVANAQRRRDGGCCCDELSCLRVFV
jgi:hypothetical protein